MENAGLDRLLAEAVGSGFAVVCWRLCLVGVRCVVGAVGAVGAGWALLWALLDSQQWCPVPGIGNLPVEAQKVRLGGEAAHWLWGGIWAGAGCCGRLVGLPRVDSVEARMR